MINLDPKVANLDILKGFLFHDKSPSYIDSVLYGALQTECLYVSSVRTGLLLILEYLGYNRNKDELLIAPYIGRCVLNSLNHNVFLSREINKRTRAILVFHQFGYTQKIDEIKSFARKRGLLIIEDCANGFNVTNLTRDDSFAKVLGFSKLLPTLMGACIVTEDAALKKYICNRRESNLTSSISRVRRLLRRYRSGHAKNSELPFDLASIYEYYPLIPRGDSLLINNLINALNLFQKDRKQRIARYFKSKQLLGEQILSLENPDAEYYYILPFLQSENILVDKKKRLSQIGIKTEVYHVDVNRNILDSHYVKCLPLPVHLEISDQRFHRMLGVLKEKNIG